MIQRQHRELHDSGHSLGSSFSYEVAVGDLNGSGHLDAFIISPSQGIPVWWNG